MNGVRCGSSIESTVEEQIEAGNKEAEEVLDEGTLKGTAKQGVNPGGQMKERDKIIKINASGVDATATVDSMQEVGSQIGGGHQIDFELTVHPADGTDYAVSTSQSMHELTLKGVEQGATVAVKVDPDDPRSLRVRGAAA